MKIAACVILYNPDESVIENIQSYINYVEKLYLIDNSEVSNLNLQKRYNFLSNATIIYDGTNEGIAKRVNQACDFAVEDEFEYLLTMDQDSYFDAASISKYFNCIERLSRKDVSMFGINYKKRPIEINCEHAEAKLLITSGSVINLESYQQIGGFDENLFIDFVDTEYCFKSIQKKFKIIEFPNIYMHHSLGKLVEKHSLKTLKKTSRSIHSEQRLYYMLRNFLYLKFKYKNQFIYELEVLKKDILTRIKNKILYTGNRSQTIKLLIKAILDYKKSKMGKQL